MLGLLAARELGRGSADCYPLHVSVHHLRAAALALSPALEIKSAHRSGVRCVDVERQFGRFLLAGDADGGLAVYDTRVPLHALAPAHAPPATARPPRPSRAAPRRPHVASALARLPKAHRYAIGSVCWYPHDAGLFVSAGYDGLVRLWDADALRPALDFDLAGRAYSLHLSARARSHGLVAVGSEEAAVRLCDLRSGARTHVLNGHTAAIWAVRWCPAREHLLASGSHDGRALLWDIRRAGALADLDKATTARARRGARASGMAAPAQRARGGAHDGGVNGLCFSPDGCELLTFGKDDRLRLWDVAAAGVGLQSGSGGGGGWPAPAAARARGLGDHLAVHFDTVANAAPRNVSLAVSAARDGGGAACGGHAYVPCGRLLHVYEWSSGKLRTRLRGHFERVNGVALAGAEQGGGETLFSCSDDHTICAWAPPDDALGAGAARAPGGCGPTDARARGTAAESAVAAAVDADADAWSDEEGDA